MRLKLTLIRAAGGAPADLMVTVDANATVGDLADHLAETDPGSPASVEHPWSLTADGAALRRDTPIIDSAIVSGGIVGMSRVDERMPSERPVVAATLQVLEGPDAGKQFPLPVGSSVIGRGRECDVRLADAMTSRRHARVHVGQVVEIFDLGSANGVVVGDQTVEAATLRPSESARLGDTVISIRNEMGLGGGATPAGPRLFNRPPQVSTRYEGRSFALPELPTAPKGRRFPIIPLFAPLLMGAALYLSTKSTTSLVFMGMSPLMMVGNVAEGAFAGKKTFKVELSKMRADLETTRSAAHQERDREAAARREENPSTSRCVEAMESADALLWCRRPDLPAFGEFRVGLGSEPTRSKIDYPLTRQTEGTDLLAEMHALLDPLGVAPDVPVAARMEEVGAFGVAGANNRSREAAAGYVLQLLALHSHAELGVAAVCGIEAAGSWEWVKWVPHCGGASTPLECQPLASSTPDVARLIGELESLVRSRSGASDRSGDTKLPRLLLIIDSPPERVRSRLIEIAEQAALVGIWVLWVAADRSLLPACCKAFVDVATGSGDGFAHFIQASRTIPVTQIGCATAEAAERSARRLAPVLDASVSEAVQGDVPRSTSLLTLVGSELVNEPDRVVERWTENRSILSGPRASTGQRTGLPGNLRAVIGESATGPHILDLRLHGPHALVGGTTGAGKSELLQSWIIGMALSNSPQRLTFLLVDYKGGSAFSDCVHLPHTVGLVTDLSPHLVRRALTSLSAELRYREQVLHRKRAKDLASLERLGDPEAPPSLVIVVDEFAALVKEVPEFVDGVVNVAQRGRSLGLHLILATQRPSGVIRDNLRANTNLRIALRMADAADSSDVIGTKAAANFDPSVPGRAASRTGPTALVPFQTAYVGGWTSSTPDKPDIVVSTWGFTPRTTWERPNDHIVKPAEGPTDIRRLVSNVEAASRLAQLPAPRKPWLSELAAVYDLAKLPTRRRDDELVFAVADDPANQAQQPISFKPDEDGNMAIFGTGNSGKSTLLRTLCIAAGITARGGPVHVYGLDFGARGLQMLEQLPHVAGIVAGNDVERVGRVLSTLRALIDRRAADFASVGAGSITQFRSISKRPNEPRILLLIDGMGGMRTAYEGTEHHRLFERFLSIAADGRQAGVNVVIAADRAGAVPSALGALIQKRVILRLAGENDYAMLGQPSDVLGPKSPPGRGLWDGLEIQVAILGNSSDVLTQDAATQSFAKAKQKTDMEPAPAIRRLEEEILLETLTSPAGNDRPVFAVAGESLDAVLLPTAGTFSVAGPPGSGRTTAVLTIVRSLKRWRPEVRTIYFGTRRSDLAGAVDWDAAGFDAESAAQVVAEAGDLLGDTDSGSAPGVLVIENLVDFVGTPLDNPLQQLIKKATLNGHLVVSDGEPVPLSGIQPLLQAARASRIGLVLQPDQSDGNLLKTQFPRLRKADFPPGRGLYVARGGLAALVQVALPGSSPR